MKARMDIPLFCHYKNIELVMISHGSQGPKLVLDKNTQLLAYQWLQSLCFPDGYASNKSILVNLKDGRLYEIKIHNYHVFIQTPISLAYWDLLPRKMGCTHED